jgi:hypothetical protein
MEILWQAWEGFGAEYVDVDGTEASGHSSASSATSAASISPGCIDVDIMAVTLDTLPSVHQHPPQTHPRRLRRALRCRLAEATRCAGRAITGEPHEFNAAFVVVPSFEVQVARQRFTASPRTSTATRASIPASPRC